METGYYEMDEFILRMWDDFSDAPFDESNTSSGLALSSDWHIFTKGTDREEIWHWFDSKYSKGVHNLLYGDDNTEQTEI
jgi:hypothetical protein